MKTGSDGLALLQGFEQCRLAAYMDGGGVPTIGWGHTAGVHMGDTCTQAQADAWLQSDLTETESCINRLVSAPLTQNQFDALVCFTYNVGTTAFAKSTLLKYLNLQKYQLAAGEFLKWNHDNGVIVLGLTRRRAAERLLFVGSAA